MRLLCAGLTDVGIARDHNEDNFYLSRAGEPLCVVADGMGGHRSGEVASEVAVKTIVDYYKETVISPEDEASALGKRFTWPWKRKKDANADEMRLVQSLLCANKAIFEASESNELYKGMGTTVVSAYFVEEGVYVAWIGDSRCYRLRNGELEQISEDHSLANEYVKMGIISKKDLEHFPYKNVVTRACGLASEVEADSLFTPTEDGDIYLLCSDGLSDCINDEKIRAILMAYEDLDAAAVALVEAANQGGGTDNITVILAKTLLA